MMIYYLSAMRIKQWPKQFLIFLPILAANKYEFIYFQKGIAGFIIFSLAASFVYIFNDLIDIKNDKIHPLKKSRPIASGKLSKRNGKLLGLILFCASFLLGFKYNILNIIIIYFILNFFYSFFLKKIKFVDIVILSLFYFIRVYFGSIILDIEISNWLFIFVFFLFTALAIIKRLNEVEKYKRKLNIYEKNDNTILLKILYICNLFSIFCLVLYSFSQKIYIIYKTPILMWVLILIYSYWLYFISSLAKSGKIEQDTIVFILTNKKSIILIVTSFIFLILIQNFKITLFS
jgi:4-hydroxybenzoate polyprenyltransferase